MGLARTLAVTLTGLTGHIVDVEAHATQGLPGFTLVGLPDAAVRESRERVRAALSTCGVTWGEQRLTVNLSPADLRKTGTGLDLALALAVLGARGRLGQSAAGALGRTVYIGELGLDGSVHSVRGILPSVQAAVAAGVGEIVVGQEAAAEAELVPDARVSAISHIGQLVERYGGRLSEGVAAAVEQISEAGRSAPAALARDDEPPDLADVVGQTEARQALEVAAAGGHHLIMVGPPGTGKTMLAERLPSILPPLEQSDAVTVTSIHSVAGTFNPARGLITRPPLRAPHAVVGGGSGLPRPGDVSLAHRGVLVLDEAPEFSAGVLDCLRQPLESGTVTIDRVGGRASYPAAFQLVLAANPCPCGKAGGRGLECTCTSLQRRRYFSRAGTPWRLNAEVPGSFLRGPDGGLSAPLSRRLMSALERGDLSLRGVDRVLRLAWTLADLEGAEALTLTHIGTALALRTSGVRP